MLESLIHSVCIIAERLSARQLIISRLAFVYMYVSYQAIKIVLDAAFVLLAHEGLEIERNRSLLFTQVGLLHD